MQRPGAEMSRLRIDYPRFTGHTKDIPSYVTWWPLHIVAREKSSNNARCSRVF
jgi:hypothetical protein